MKAVQFPAVTMIIGEQVNTSVFADGKVNQMWVHEPTDGGAAAREFGYGDQWWTFITEHDLAHHFVADRLGWPHSYAIHDAPPVPLAEAPAEVQHDEHMANRMLALINLGQPDPHGCLQAEFGDRLDAAAFDLAKLLDETCGPRSRTIWAERRA